TRRAVKALDEAGPRRNSPELDHQERNARNWKGVSWRNEIEWGTRRGRLRSVGLRRRTRCKAKPEIRRPGTAVPSRDADRGRRKIPAWPCYSFLDDRPLGYYTEVGGRVGGE